MFKAFLTFLAAVAGASALPAAADPAASAAAQTELAAAIHGYQAALLHRGQAPLAPGRLGVPEDWTHHHLVFSAPQAGSAAESRVLNDPRYWQQRLNRALHAARAESATALPMALARRKTNKGLWEYNLGAGGRVGAGMYPAKYSFAVSSAICDSYNGTTHTIGDFVVYNTGGLDTAAVVGALGSATQPTIVGMSNLYSSCPTAANPAGRFPVVAWAYNTGSVWAATSPVLSLDGTKVAFVEGGVTSGATLRILKPFAPATGSQGYYGHATAAADVSWTTSSKTVTSTSAEFAVEDVGQAFTSASSGIPANTTIATYNSPMSVTLNNTPTVAHSAVSATLGTLNTWSVGTIGNQALTSWGSCTAAQSCMITVAFNGNRGDVYSAPFYDYDTDTLYVGDSGGFLHKFTGVFNGTPAEAGAPWPAAAVTGVASSPVYDSGSGNIYMGDRDHSGNESATLASTGGVTRVTGGHLPTDMTGSSLSPNECTPVTEFLNGTTDEFYVGLQKNGFLTGCTGSTTLSCLYYFTSTSTDSTFPSNATAGLATTGGTAGNFSGIIIDNSSATAGAAQVYFTPLADQACTTSGGTGGCAYQASQGALQ